MSLTELRYLEDTFRGYASDCVESVVDFSQVEYRCSDTSMELVIKDGSFSRPVMNFRINPADNKDPLAVHAHKQLCKILKVPYAFFAQNRPKMRETVVKNWIAGLIPEESSSIHTLRVRSCRDVDIIRAIMPAKAVDYPNYRVVGSLIKYGESQKMTLSSIIGDEVDSPSTELAVRLGDVIEWAGAAYRLALIATFSDISTANIKVDAALMSEDGRHTFLLGFDHRSLLDLSYQAMTPTDMDKVLSGLPGQLLDLKPILEDKLLQAQSREYFGVETSLEIVCSQISTASVIKKMRREFIRDDADEEYPDAVAFARGVASLAKSYDGTTRTLLERLAGSFLMLDLPAPDINKKGEPIEVKM